MQNNATNKKNQETKYLNLDLVCIKPTIGFSI